MQILLVDDRLDSSTIIADWLGEFFGPVSVEWAASGAEALNAIGRSCAELVLATHRMPAMDGVGLAGVIKARPNPPVVVVVGATGDGEFETQCAAAGADFWLEKRQLQARLLAFLQQRFAQAWAEGVRARRISARSEPALAERRSHGSRRFQG
jgi:CheY-like chemotaxis protein